KKGGPNLGPEHPVQLYDPDTDSNIDGTVLKEENEKYYDFLSGRKTIDKKAQDFLRKQFIVSDSHSFPLAVKWKVLKIAEKDQDFATSFLPQVRDIVIKYECNDYYSPTFLEEYLCWYVRHANDCDFAVNLYKDKTGLCSVRLLVEAAQMSGDAGRYVLFADDMLKSCKDVGSREMLKKNMIILLKFQNNLTDDDRVKILKWNFENFSWNLSKGSTIHPQNIAALRKMANSSENPKEREIAYYLLTTRVNDADWPDDFAAEYVEKFTSDLLSNKDPNVRLNAIKHLLSYKSQRNREKIVEALTRAIQDPDNKVVQSTCDALEKQGSSVLPVLVGLVNGKDPYASTKACKIIGGMSLFSKDAVPALAKAIESSDWTIRTAALDAIGQIGPPAREHLPLIIKCVDDQNAEVGKSAGKALVLLGGIKKGDPVLKKIIELEVVKKGTFTDEFELFQKRAMEGLE
ncbi:MAG: HEAT repeat domain-containing protein, partial [Victivallales bacterium]